MKTFNINKMNSKVKGLLSPNDNGGVMQIFNITSTSEYQMGPGNPFQPVRNWVCTSTIRINTPANEPFTSNISVNEKSMLG